MRLFSRVFFSVTAILCLALSLLGSLMISASLHTAYSGETQRAADAFLMLRYVLETTFDARGRTKEFDAKEVSRILSDIPHGSEVAIYDEEKNCLFLEAEHETDEQWLLPGLSNTALTSVLRTRDDRQYLTTGGFLHLFNRRLMLTVSHDVTNFAKQTDAQLSSYRILYLLICGISLFAVALVTLGLVRPIGRTARSAAKIAKGQYHTRVKVTSDDELGDLARSFNTMAQAIDRSVEALQASVEEQEEFVANFAHELKTPLTSVIGYADMLARQETEPEQARAYARYILDEGLRLEALSYKLMELIVLNKQDFVLEELRATEVFDNIEEGLKPLFAEKEVTSEIRTQDAWIRIEFDLFKTMMLNLIDNAVKADAKHVELAGEIKKDEEGQTVYEVLVRDDGRGIPAESLSRITETFYMVDKSRSRAQHGAGLGLALVKRIVQLHHAKLTFESGEGKGTCVRVTLPLEPEEGAS